MRHRYGSPPDPMPWPPSRPDPPARSTLPVPGQAGWADGPILPASGLAERYIDGDWSPDDPDEYGDTADRARARGLRRLSKLTWRATQLSAVTAVGFAALFSHTTHFQTVSSPAPAKLAPRHSTVSPSPSPSPTKKRHHHKHHHHATLAAAPNAGAASGTGSGGGAGSASAAAPSPTLAPPTTAPAPAPSPAPTQSTSSGSHHV